MEILDNRIHHLLALQQKRKQIFLTEIEVNTEDLTTSKVDEEFLKKRWHSSRRIWITTIIA